jgi:hypothetical protein
MQLGSHTHTFESVRECEGMNSHTPKWTPALGVGVPINSQIFIERFEGSKLIVLNSFLFHWKAFKT